MKKITLLVPPSDFTFTPNANPEHPSAERVLPRGKRCSDCFYFHGTCEWLISRIRTETECDWFPIRFQEKT